MTGPYEQAALEFNGDITAMLIAKNRHISDTCFLVFIFCFVFEFADTKKYEAQRNNRH